MVCTRDLGDGFVVRRALPHGKRQMVGPFIFLDQMGPAEFAPGAVVDDLPEAAAQRVGEVAHRAFTELPSIIAPGRRSEQPRATSRSPVRTAMSSPIPGVGITSGAMRISTPFTAQKNGKKLSKTPYGAVAAAFSIISASSPRTIAANRPPARSAWPSRR